MLRRKKTMPPRSSIGVNKGKSATRLGKTMTSSFGRGSQSSIDEKAEVNPAVASPNDTVIRG